MHTHMRTRIARPLFLSNAAVWSGCLRVGVVGSRHHRDVGILNGQGIPLGPQRRMPSFDARSHTWHSFASKDVSCDSPSRCFGNNGRSTGLRESARKSPSSRVWSTSPTPTADLHARRSRCVSEQSANTPPIPSVAVCMQRNRDFGCLRKMMCRNAHRRRSRRGTAVALSHPDPARRRTLL